MPMRVRWSGGPPEDHEEWEDVLTAEQGTSLENVDLLVRRVGAGWELSDVGAPRASGDRGQPSPRLDAVPRFVNALRLAGKPVIGATADEADELQAVSADDLEERAERVRRDGQSDE